MRVLPWLSKATVVSAGLLLTYFIFEVVILLVQYQLVEPHTRAFYQYLQLNSLYLFALISAIWIIYRTKFNWLAVYVFIVVPIFYLRSGARWTITQTWHDTEFINTIWYYGYWATFIFFSLLIYLYFYWWYQENKNNLYATLLKKTYLMTSVVLLAIIPLYLIGFYYSSLIYSPIMYMTTPNVQAAIYHLYPSLIFTTIGFFAAWLIYHKQLYILSIYILLSAYYGILSNSSAFNALRNTWGRTDTLALASQVEAISLILFFAVIVSLFFVWLYEHHRMDKE